MSAVVFRGPGDMRLEDVARPKVQQGTDGVTNCRAGSYSPCGNASPNGPASPLVGGPESAGGPSTATIKPHGEVDGDRAIPPSCVFPARYFGAAIAGIHAGNTVAVFGCGWIGRFAIASAPHLGARRVMAIGLDRAVDAGVDAASPHGQKKASKTEELRGVCQSGHSADGQLRPRMRAAPGGDGARRSVRPHDRLDQERIKYRSSRQLWT